MKNRNMADQTRRATEDSKSRKEVNLRKGVPESSESKPQFWMRMKSIKCVIKSSKKTNRGENWIYWKMPNHQTNVSKTKISENLLYWRMPKLQTNVSKTIHSLFKSLRIPSMTRLNAWQSLKNPRISQNLFHTR